MADAILLITVLSAKPALEVPTRAWLEASYRRVILVYCMEPNPKIIRLHPHAVTRLGERGASEAEVIATVQDGERFPAKRGRQGFRRNFSYNDVWRGRYYTTKQVEAFAVEEDGWLVITILVRFF